MTPEEESAIIETVRTFRAGAPLVIDDILFAAAVDGHDLSSVKPYEWSRVLATVCDSMCGPYGRHDRRSWVVRGNQREAD